MTNNTDNNDEFEQDDFQGLDEPKPAGGLRSSITEAWRTKPIFKLIVIMAGVGLAAAAALGAFSSPPDPAASTMVTAPELREAPGGKASPYFIEQNKQANAQRANQALQEGGSALPTPVGNPVDIDDLTNPNKKDPLMEFRAETERLKEEMKQQQQQQQQQMQGLQQQVQVASREPEDDSLAKAMQAQMRQLMEGWTPRSMKLIAGTGKADVVETKTARDEMSGQAMNASATTAPINVKALIAAGTVNYAQLLTEANSDVQAPILAQVLSGPLAGGRAIGKFQVMNDYLVMEFTLVTLKGKDYTIDAIALDPGTTLAGMATEVDHRYFTRILLPAAGAFVSAFGSAMGDSGSSTTVSDGTVIVNKAKQGIDDAVYAGIGQAGSTAAQFFQQQASQTKTLVRVAVGTPMGLFFLSSVKDPSVQQPQQQIPTDNQSLGAALAAAYGGSAGATGYSVIGAGQSSNATNTNNSYNPYATTNPYATSAYGTNAYTTNSTYNSNTTRYPTSSGVYTTTRY